MKLDFKIVLTLALILIISCVTPKANIIETDQEQVCSDLNKIDSTIFRDISFRNYFSIDQKDNIVYFKPKYITIGFPRSLLSEITDIRYHSDSTKNENQVYSGATIDLLKYQSDNKSLRYLCKNDNITRLNSDFELNYWYSPIDSLYSIEIVRILKKPGHTQGYLFITKKILNNFSILRRSYWTE
jgi:hypothetical protein